MRKARLWGLLLFLLGTSSLIGQRDPESYQFLWELHLEVCHHPKGVCSGPPPPPPN